MSLAAPAYTSSTTQFHHYERFGCLYPTNHPPKFMQGVYLRVEIIRQTCAELWRVIDCMAYIATLFSSCVVTIFLNCAGLKESFCMPRSFNKFDEDGMPEETFLTAFLQGWQNHSDSVVNICPLSSIIVVSTML